MFCLVYGFSNAASHNWRTPSTWGFLAAGVILLVIFVWWQTRAAHPLLPLRILLDRNRGGAYLAVLIAGAGMFGIFLFLTYYLDTILGLLTRGDWPRVPADHRHGHAVLADRQHRPDAPHRAQVAGGPGMPLAAAGLMRLTQIGLHSNYASAILGPPLVTGAGIGLALLPSMNTGTFGVAPKDAGVASATLNVGQQLGGSIGTALLNTIATSATASYLAGLYPSAAGGGPTHRAGRSRRLPPCMGTQLRSGGRPGFRGRCRCLRLPAALGSAGPANRNADRRSRGGASGRSIRPRLSRWVVGSVSEWRTKV